MRKLVLGCLALLAGLGMSGSALAQGNAADVLAGQGLKKLSTGQWVLEGEKDLSTLLRNGTLLEKAVKDAGKDQKAVEKKKSEIEFAIQKGTEARIILTRQLQTPGLENNVTQYNRVVAAIQEAEARMQLMTNALVQMENEITQVNAKASKARADYMKHVITLREAVNATGAKYAALTTNTEVQEAIKSLSKTDGKEYKLGPSRSHELNIRKVTDMESHVYTESIALRKEGEIFWAQVTINGKDLREMMVGTSAESCQLPSVMAKDLGIVPTAQDPDVKLILADGREASGKLVKLASLKVGRFSVENVDCIVLGAELIEGRPVLGQSFLRHFEMRLDPSGSKLNLAEVVTGAPPGQVQ